MTGDSRRSFSLGITLALMLSGMSAAAAEPPRGQAREERDTRSAAAVSRAEDLFAEGRTLYDAGLFQEACAKLAESQELDPRVGTEGLLASCREQEGKLATAYRGYLSTEQRALLSGDPRGQFAAERASALAPRVPKLTIRVVDPAPGLQVTLNGDRVPTSALSAKTLLDPGTAVIEATAPGRKPFSATVQMTSGEHKVVAIPALAPRQVAAQPGPVAEKRGSTGTSPRKLVGWTVGAIGLAGIGVGTGLGVLAFTQRSASNEYCGPSNRCAPEGGALRDEARVTANVATASFAAGLAGVGVGALLVLLPEPRTERSTGSFRPQLVPVAGPTSGGAVLRGRF
ncbi:hypothetical protein [Chondromyces crocatus]|uniref:PEGA domain-containing protein n=1 Tax=Chondromyces crocatus TaxID=52 RepID=A0A0K1ELC7_CHOCO|nr:hypothetical protein [Chondromyces crocatus]AKT41418.1 uncharacterized protein CMC5_056180 [Chondromyces crocatus]